ncbi:MAG TPA: 4Fe-4S dicluster domain-containing protein [Lacunisphaera sp.]|jgi:molybdopterin-containing oxidoreductase family iron-sulfur binding subunit|nr:4Fe-4S dicluster domain-containing protein [Lacunisphaera sp.]
MPPPFPHPLLRRDDEFAPGSESWPEGMSRRRFLELMAASLALAGLGACNRPPDGTIVPYVVPPDREMLEDALYYATAMPWDGYARGVLARSHSGRPTKLEGNAVHPDSLGATDALTQAAVLALYDPDRSRAPRRGGQVASWARFEDEWLGVHRDLLSRHGRGLALLTEPTTSPTELRCIHALLDRLPAARWFQHTALARFDRDGRQDDYDFGRADVVLAVEADFLFDHPSSLRYARAFASRRRVEGGRVNANRLYVIEASPSVTGSMADHRLAASPAHARRLLAALGDLLDGNKPSPALAHEERRVLAALARDLQGKAPNVVCVAGESCDDAVRDWCAARNARLGAACVTHHALPAIRSDADPRSAGDLGAAVQAMQAGGIDTLVVVGANPAYTAPADLEFARAMARVARRIHLGSHVDETAALCPWHLPEAHFLEAWSDLRAYDGTASIVQPLIAPLYGSRTAAEFIGFLAAPAGRNGYDLVRETWQHHGGADFEAAWVRWLNTGVVDGTTASRSKPTAPAKAPDLRAGASSSGVMLTIRPDPTVRDGRWANNAWLQELPKQNSQLVWDNAVFVSPTLAATLQIENGDVVQLSVAANGRSPISGRTEPARSAGSTNPNEGPTVEGPAWIALGQADDCVTVSLGYGRTAAGRVGNAVGFDAYPLRQSASPWAREGVTVRKLGRRHALVSTQTHFAMEGRDIVRVALASDPAGTAGRPPETPPSLYPPVEYPEYRWGMLIDLGACIGCKACVAACQAENNIPVVGKEQVGLGREMHWIRVDRYHSTKPGEPPVLHQPVPCMQCENAPCELVCPVAATVHSSEGLNDMVYNRCVGTRYCSNNCPYKVRRFNFLDFRAPADSPVNLQKNPEVTVRARGVMEKCTYCVQRINAGRITAEKANRRIRDGDVRTACQQACPTEAIVFGDLNDPAARVVARKAEPTHYALLEELNTRPRTTYLARTTNPALAGANRGDAA